MAMFIILKISPPPYIHSGNITATIHPFWKYHRHHTSLLYQFIVIRVLHHSENITATIHHYYTRLLWWRRSPFWKYHHDHTSLVKQFIVIATLIWWACNINSTVSISVSITFIAFYHTSWFKGISEYNSRISRDNNKYNNTQLLKNKKHMLNNVFN